MGTTDYWRSIGKRMKWSCINSTFNIFSFDIFLLSAFVLSTKFIHTFPRTLRWSISLMNLKNQRDSRLVTSIFQKNFLIENLFPFTICPIHVFHLQNFNRIRNVSSKQSPTLSFSMIRASYHVVWIYYAHEKWAKFYKLMSS
jgi:hypothetical protein